MKDRVIGIIKFLVAFGVFYTLSSIIIFIIKQLKFAIVDYQDLTVISSASEVILTVVVFNLYRKDFLKDFNFLNDDKVVTKVIKYFCLFWFVKIISAMLMAELCSLFGYDVSISENQEVVNSFASSAPILMLLTSSITTPIVEEGIFRLGIGNAIKNKYLFIVVSGLVFGLLHIFPTDLSLPYALITSIPYVSIGMTLAYIYKKEDNIYHSILQHGINNFISMILFICS